MALNAQVGTLTSFNSTGDKVISLPANFDPKFIMLWGGHNQADGDENDRHMCRGFASYRSSVVSQFYHTIKCTNAQTTVNTNRGMGTGSIYKLFNKTADNVTVDVAATLVSMATGASSSVTLNVSNAHASAIRVHYLILGGSDITDVLVGTATTNASAGNMDVTVTAGFGKPNLLFMMGGAFTAMTDTQASIYDSFGWGIQGQAGRCTASATVDGNTASLHAMSARSDRILRYFTATTPTVEVETRLDTVAANWPTDGFRLIETTDGFAESFGYAAIKGTFQMLDGNDTAPTSGSLPVIMDDSLTFAPVVALQMNWALTTTSGVDNSNAALGAMGFGAYDGISTAFHGWAEEDAAGTSNSSSQSSTTQFIRHYDDTATLQSEATAQFIGPIFRRLWGDIDTTAREHHWLVLGSAATPIAPLYQRTNFRQMTMIWD